MISFSFVLEMASSCTRGASGWVSGKIPLLNRGQAQLPRAVGEDWWILSIPGGLNRCVDVTPGDAGLWWPWQCWDELRGLFQPQGLCDSMVWGWGGSKEGTMSRAGVCRAPRGEGGKEPGVRGGLAGTWSLSPSPGHSPGAAEPHRQGLSR